MLSSIFLFFSFSASEIMFILFVALILFGGDKFPEIARGLGKGIREFKDMSDGVKREIHSQINNYDMDRITHETTESTQNHASGETKATPPPESGAVQQEPGTTHETSVTPPNNTHPDHT